jgi:hypothetical protein
MYNPLNHKQRSATFLYILVIANSLSILLVGLLLPPLVGFVGLLFGFYLYYLSYAVPAKSIWLRELRLLIVAMTGVTLGLSLLILSCKFLVEQRVCSSATSLNSQIFASYAFTLIFLIVSWLFYRLPALIREMRNQP